METLPHPPADQVKVPYGTPAALREHFCYVFTYERYVNTHFGILKIYIYYFFDILGWRPHSCVNHRRATHEHTQTAAQVATHCGR